MGLDDFSDFMLTARIADDSESATYSSTLVAEMTPKESPEG
jgi:hypothetical protein